MDYILNKTDEDLQDCNTQLCPAWTPWEEWSACTLSCMTYDTEPGVRFRERGCFLDMDECIERAGDQQTEVEYCNTHLCNVYSDWSEWSDCSVSCEVNNISLHALCCTL